MLPVASLGLALLLLSGCLPQSPTVMPTPQPSSTPVFASDEEALAAAEAAYAEYLRVSDAITADGGANPERIEPLVTESQRKAALASFVVYATKGLRTEGASKHDSLALQHYSEPGEVILDLYVCVDVTDIRVLDASGADITPAGRVNRVPLEISYVGSSAEDLKLDRSEAWSGDDFCKQ